MRQLFVVAVGMFTAGWSAGFLVGEREAAFESDRADRYQALVESSQSQLTSDSKRMKQDVEELTKATDMLDRCATWRVDK